MTMPEETKQALEESIAHWERNIENAKLGRAVDISASACALCCEFYIPNQHCIGCPVAAIGHAYCTDTPYWHVREAKAKGDKNKLIATCRAELDFLINLRPSEETNP